MRPDKRFPSTALSEQHVGVLELQTGKTEFIKSESVSVARTLPNRALPNTQSTESRTIWNGVSGMSWDRMSVPSLRLAKLIRIPEITHMTVRVRCNGMHLSYLDGRPPIAASHNLHMTTGIGELYSCKGSDLIFVKFTQKIPMLPRNTVMEYAKQSPLTVFAPFRETGERYA